MPSLVDRLNAIEDLPTIPHTMQQVLSSLDAIATSAQTLENIIKDDPVLTAQVLKLANSPVYGGGVEIASLARAIVTLGLDEVRNVVVGLSLSGIFCDDLGFAEFDSGDLWLHSIGVATCARMIARRVDGVDEEEIFTAGMLHDLGRILYCLYFPDELRDVLSNVKGPITLQNAEEQYGLTHAEIGAYLAFRWKLGDFMVHTIRYHHQPRSAGSYAMAASVVNLADAITMQLEIGWKEPSGSPKITVPKILGLDGAAVKEIALKMRDDKEKIMAGWSSVINA